MRECSLTQMGDGTLYSDDALRQMSRAPTRVRFQFRRDHSYHPAPKGLTAFPDAVLSPSKSSVKGVGAKA